MTTDIGFPSAWKMPALQVESVPDSGTVTWTAEDLAQWLAAEATWTEQVGLWLLAENDHRVDVAASTVDITRTLIECSLSETTLIDQCLLDIFAPAVPDLEAQLSLLHDVQQVAKAWGDLASSIETEVVRRAPKETPLPDLGVLATVKRTSTSTTWDGRGVAFALIPTVADELAAEATEGDLSCPEYTDIREQVIATGRRLIDRLGEASRLEGWRATDVRRLLGDEGVESYRSTQPGRRRVVWSPLDDAGKAAAVAGDAT